MVINLLVGFFNSHCKDFLRDRWRFPSQPRFDHGTKKMTQKMYSSLHQCPPATNFQCPAVKGTVPAGETDSAAVGRYKKKDTRMQLQLEDLKISMFSGKFSVNERHHNPKKQHAKFGKKNYFEYLHFVDFWLYPFEEIKWVAYKWQAKTARENCLNKIGSNWNLLE